MEQVKLEQELSQSYLSYALSVILSRALPDARDGLKPVQRRILYAMSQLGLDPNSDFKKSARIVGEVLGKYHPHGDAPVYDALTRMAQDFCMRYPLIQGQGNFGSIDGDPPAAMRYTGARLSSIAMELLDGLDQGLVEFSPNFDHTSMEPQVLPAKFPNLLANGCLGIAVGFSTNIPPHNLGEVIDGILAYLEDPGIGNHQLAQLIKGPDFPTGGIALGDFPQIQARGRGKFLVRARISLVKFKRSLYLLVDQIPYLVSKSELVSQIWELIKSKKLPELVEVLDASDSSGIKIYLKLSPDADPHQAIQKLYSLTKLQIEFRQLNLVVLNNLPMVADLKKLIQIYVEHRRQVIQAKLSKQLSQIREKASQLEAIIKLGDRWEDALRILVNSRARSQAKRELMRSFKLSSSQADHLLKLRLEQLLSSQLAQAKEQHRELLEKIHGLESLLENRSQLDQILKQELIQLKSKYADPRRTQLISSELGAHPPELIG